MTPLRLVSYAVLTATRAEAPPHVAVWQGDGGPCVNALGPGFDIYAAEVPEGTRLIVSVWEEPADAPRRQYRDAANDLLATIRSEAARGADWPGADVVDAVQQWMLRQGVTTTELLDDEEE